MNSTANKSNAKAARPLPTRRFGSLIIGYVRSSDGTTIYKIVLDLSDNSATCQCKGYECRKTCSHIRELIEEETAKSKSRRPRFQRRREARAVIADHDHFADIARKLKVQPSVLKRSDVEEILGDTEWIAFRNTPEFEYREIGPGHFEVCGAYYPADEELEAILIEQGFFQEVA